MPELWPNVNVTLEHYIKAMMTLTFSPKRIRTWCLFHGTEVHRRVTIPGSSQGVWRLLGCEWGRNRSQSSVPGSLAKSLWLESTYHRIRNLCLELFGKFNQNLDENTRPLSRDQCTEHTHFFLWYGQSDHRWWPSLGVMQFWVLVFITFQTTCPKLLSQSL